MPASSSTPGDELVNLERDLLAAVGPRVRLSPFFDRTVAAGLTSVSSYNHMWIPMSYGDPDAEYERLTNGVTLWDVAAQRHIEVAGRDADAVVQLMTVVDTATVEVGAAAYAPMVDHDGRLVNDPVLLHVGDSEWRFSIADGDVRLWIDATARAHGLDCTVIELDTATLAVQGPRTQSVMEELGLGWTAELDSFCFESTTIDRTTIRVSNSGWSHQGGVEIFLDDPDRAGWLWDLVHEAGDEFDIGPAAPNPSERIENVLLSYGTDTGYQADPFELGLGERVDFSSGYFVGRPVLADLVEREPERRLRGVLLDGERMQILSRPLPIEVGDSDMGELRAAAWSPRFGRNLGLVLAESDVTAGATVHVVGHDSVERGEVVDLPFDDVG